MYGKIFDSIFKSTLVSEGGWLPTYIFMSMVTIADKDGIVNISTKSLYNLVGFRSYDSKISLEDFRLAIDYLESEDPESNSPTENGRRIIPLSKIDEIPDNRGWFVVNYDEYKKKASKYDEREATAERVRRFRERKKCNGSVTECNGKKRNDNGKNGHIDIDTDIDLDKKNYSADFLEFWKHYPKKIGKGKAYQSWKKLKNPKITLTKIQLALKWQKKSEQWQKDNGQYIPNPSTYLNQRRWEDESNQKNENKSYNFPKCKKCGNQASNIITGEKCPYCNEVVDK